MDAFFEIAHTSIGSDLMKTPRYLPAKLTPELACRIVRRELSRFMELQIEEFRRIIKTPLEPCVQETCILVFPDKEGEADLLNAWMYFTGKASRVDHNDPRHFAGRSLPLCGYDHDSLPRIGSNIYTAEIAEQIADSIKTWLAQCWWKAGGWDFTVPAHVSVAEGLGNNESEVLSPGSVKPLQSPSTLPAASR